MARDLLAIGAVLVLGLIALLAYHVHLEHGRSGVAVSRHTNPILIPGIQEPEEMRVEPIPVEVPTEPDRMLGEAMEQVGNSKSPAALLPALDRILAKYPDYSDGYLLRLVSLCEGNDRAAILSNINSALKYIGNSRIGKDSLGSLLSMRAKIEHANGDDGSAMEDLDKAIHANLGDPTQFVNSGAVAPEKSASACTWTAPDMDALVQRFPDDYRAYLMRGLYYGFFKWNEGSLRPAIENVRKAGEMNAASALPHFFMAYIYKRDRLGMSDAQRENLNHEMLTELTTALRIDPNLLPALIERAEVYYELKQFQEAVPDYDKILSLDPTNAGAYNDRALAEMELGNTYDAISDFGEAIKNKKRELLESSSYENRATAYMKTQQWDLAISDLTTAISLQVPAVLILGNIKQFRALYPEYATASDEAVAHKLNQTFYPVMKYEDFSKGFLHHEKALSVTLPELYLQRSDAYLKAGRWHHAAVDFRRATDGFANYADAFARWRGVGSFQNSQVYIDMKTFDDTHSDCVKLWIKQADTPSVTGPYSLQQFELNCEARQIRSVSFVDYGASGNVVGGREGENWGSVVPDTLGETLFNGVCRGGG
ncbi:MAG: surface-adhesin E family protein [Candidatus Binatia bacterium]